MKNLTAKHVMNPDVLVAESNWSVNHLAEFFMENCISGAPVQSNAGILIGVVSLTDIVNHEIQTAGGWQGPHDYYLHVLERQYVNRENVAFQIEAEPDVMVRDIMTPTIFQVSENTTVQRVADVMIKNHIHRVFVTNKDKIVG
ncbi:MAG: hypothetical protein DRH90_21895, partial [Deltaproteobacteria bacterium]